MTETVYVYDEEGNVLAEKSKNSVDKIHDILATVYVKVFVNDKLLLSKILQKEGGISKMYEGKWGAPVATIIRVGESPESAFKRACFDDIGSVPVIINAYEKEFWEFSNGSKRFVYQFDAKLDEVPVIDGKEFILASQEEVTQRVAAGEVAETYTKLLGKR